MSMATIGEGSLRRYPARLHQRFPLRCLRTPKDTTKQTSPPCSPVDAHPPKVKGLNINDNHLLHHSLREPDTLAVVVNDGNSDRKRAAALKLPTKNHQKADRERNVGREVRHVCHGPRSQARSRLLIAHADDTRRFGNVELRWTPFRPRTTTGWQAQ